MKVPIFRIFSVLLLLLCVNAQNPPENVYSVPIDGAEVINFPSPIVLTYASNIQMDLNETSDDVYTLYFTAGRRLSNLYTAQFQTNPTNPVNKFWATGVPLPTSASPFLTFSVLGNNILGPAFPSNLTVSNFVIQSVYLGSQATVLEYNTPGLSIVSTIISPVTDSGTGNNYVYLAGWDNSTSSNFVVARATIKPNQPDPSFQLNLEKDVLTIPLTDLPQCYDQYDEVAHPQMYLKSDQLFVLVPKRCSLFILINLPSNPLTEFNTLHPQVHSPASKNEIYVSSAVFDPDDSIIYYTLKSYNIPGAKLCYFDAKTWIPNSFYYELELTEAENLLVLGSESGSTNYIFVIASGANKVQRLSISSNYSLYALTNAAISPAINRISSAWYFRPYLYFTTYEPDAKLGRLSKPNFCKDWCGDYGYCTNGYCSCREGYSFDGSDPTRLCIPSSLASERDKDKETQGTAAALGVLFALSLLAAIAGWVMWWRTRKLHKLPGGTTSYT